MLAATARKYKLKAVRILAIDTSSPAGSLALLSEDELIAAAALEGQRYSTELMPGIAGLLSQAGCKPGELDALAVAVGPGAFLDVLVLALALVAPFGLRHEELLLK